MTMIDKTMTIAEIVATLKDGMTIGMGGWGGRRKPMALVREIVRSDLKDLTIVAYSGCDVGMLLSSGKVRKLVYGFATLDFIPLEAHYRKARQAGAFEVMELDEGMLQWGLKAAANRLPYLPTRVGAASDVLKHSPHIKMVECPYTGEPLVAMPAIKIDVALCHVNKADKMGNSWIYGPDPFFDEWFARAADATYLTCEELVETEAFNDKAETLRMPIERPLVKGVAVAECGAHPTSCAPSYGADVKHLKTYSAAAKEGWEDYLTTYVTGKDHQGYIAEVGGADHIRTLPLPVF